MDIDNHLDIPEEVARNFRWNFTVNAIDITFYMFALNVVSQVTILPLLVSELTSSRIAIGMIPALFSLGFFLPQLFTANYAEGLRRKKPFIVLISGTLERGPYLLIGLILLWLAKPAPGLTLELFFVLLVVSAAAGGVTFPAWYDLIAKVIPLHRRGLWWGTGNSLGALLGVAGAGLSGVILTSFPFPTNFAVCFLIASALMVVSFAGLALNREPESLVVKQATPITSYFKRLPGLLRGDPNFVQYIITRSITNLGGMAAGFITVYAVETFHVSGGEVGGLTAVLVGSQAVMNLLWGLIADKRGNKILVCFATFGMALTILLVHLAGSPGLLWIIYALLGFSMSADTISSTNILLEFCSEADRPTYLGLANTLLAPTKFLAPILGGWIATWTGYPPMFLAAAATSVVGGLFIAFWVREPRRRLQLEAES
jgi:MFS family permease